MSRRWVTALGAAALLAGLTGIGYRHWTAIRPLPAGPSEGMLQERIGSESMTTEVNAKAPAFVARSLDDSTIRSIDYVGRKVMLLEFWSVFCTSCIQEMPFLSELQERYRNDGLEVIGVNTDYFSRERIRRFFAKLEPPPVYTVIHDGSQEISKAFHVEALPVTVLIDSAGWIRMYHLGYQPSDQKTIESLVRKWVGKIRETGETVGPVEGKTPVAAGVTTTLQVGELLPDCEARDAGGRTVRIGEFRRGRPLAIFFWSLFCKPCREEMPLISEAAERLGRERDMSFLSVNVDSQPLEAQVRRFLERQRLPFPTLLDARAEPPGSLAALLKVTHTPTVILVDAQGLVRLVVVGELSPGEITRTLEKAAGAVGG